jgi:hypothetical protein
VLRYAQELHGQVDSKEVLDQTEKTLGELEAIFGRLTPLQFLRLRVYLFPTGHPVQDLFVKAHGETSLPPLPAVGISFAEVRLDDHLRRELRHLFNERWNQGTPPLVDEGLASWLEGNRGYDIDEAAAACLAQEDCQLRSLLAQATYLAASGSHALAASFSGFLIRRFGPDAYGRFYRNLRADKPFDPVFKRHFGMTLEEAEKQWQGQLPQVEMFPWLPQPGNTEWWVRRFQ